MAISGSNRWANPPAPPEPRYVLRGGAGGALALCIAAFAAGAAVLTVVSDRQRLPVALPNDTPQVVEATARVALLKTLGDRIVIDQLAAAYPHDPEIRAACGFLRQVDGGSLESFVATARPAGGWTIKLEGQLGHDAMRDLWGETGCADPIIPEAGNVQ